MQGASILLMSRGFPAKSSAEMLGIGVWMGGPELNGAHDPANTISRQTIRSGLRLEINTSLGVGFFIDHLP